VGELELPTLWRLERTADPKKHFVIKSVLPVETQQALEDIRIAAIGAKRKSLLLFIHGYNASFADAALRTAQLTNDLVFPGVVMFFSWPSDGNTKGYSHDEESVELAKPILDMLLNDLERLPFDEIFILGHSMGSRLTTKVLASRAQSGVDDGKIREMLLGAPDINSEIFRKEIAPALSGLVSMHKTIYASSNDLALRASKLIHEFRRVGETIGGVMVFPGFDTIDASNAAPYQRSFGHSYIFDSRLVLADLADALVQNREVARRSLKQRGTGNNRYWLLE
jgi:esterase/lipase superfamily enzyme